MDCCGRKRSAMSMVTIDASHSTASIAPGRSRRAMPGIAGGDRVVALRYRERAPVRVRGPATGRFYAFSAAQPTRQVDARDAGPLLRTGRFVRVEPEASHR